ncbi:Uncharacterised protein [Bordetella pertussis]|nr:Uncharacterised protein [Bordetella pertussis]
MFTSSRSDSCLTYDNTFCAPVLPSASSSLRRAPTEACTVSTLSSDRFSFLLAVASVLASAAAACGSPLMGVSSAPIRSLSVSNTSTLADFGVVTAYVSPAAGWPSTLTFRPPMSMTSPGLTGTLAGRLGSGGVLVTL